MDTGKSRESRPGESRRRDPPADRRPLPDLPQHHRRRVSRETLDILRRYVPLQIHEVPSGTRSSTGPCPRNGTSATPTSGIQGREGRRFPEVEPARRQLQRAREPRVMSLAELQAASLHPAGQARLDPVPHVLLRGELGILPRDIVTSLDLGGRRTTRSSSTPAWKTGT